MFLAQFIGLSAELWKNHQTDFHETCWNGVACAMDKPTVFWSRSESQSECIHNYFTFIYFV